MDFPRSLEHETRRVAALHALDLLNTQPEPEFDTLVALAAQSLDCPMAPLTLADRERQAAEIARRDRTLRQAERLRARLESTLRLPVTAGAIGMTAAETVGFATVGPDPHGVRELVRRADADLYAANRARMGSRRVREQRAGRRRVLPGRNKPALASD